MHKLTRVTHANQTPSRANTLVYIQRESWIMYM
jgi:hypothetical protein